MEKRRMKVESKRKEPKNKLFYAGLVSLFIHGAVPLVIERDTIKEHLRIELRTDDVSELLKDINSNLEKGEGIQDISSFLFQAEYLEMGYSEKEREMAKKEFNKIVEQAKELQNQGKNKQEIADYLLSEQGEYNKHQNSLIDLLIKSKIEPEEIDPEDTGMEKEYRTGNCEARWKFLTAALSEVFPEDSKNIKTQVFSGADNDGNGRPDNPGHVRVSIELNNGQQLIVEGKNSFTEPVQELSLGPTTVPSYEMLATGYLAKHGMYDHEGGNTQGASSKGLYNSIFTFPSSPVSYSAWENPDDQSSPFYSNSDRNKFVVEYIPTKTLTLEDIKGKELSYEEISEFMDIDIKVLQALANNDSMDSGTRAVILSKLMSSQSFESINYLRSEEVASLLVQIDNLYGLSLVQIGSESILKIITDKTFGLRFQYKISPSEAIIINQGNNRNIILWGLQNPESLRLLSKKNIYLKGTMNEFIDFSKKNEWPELTLEMAESLSELSRDFIMIDEYKIDPEASDILSRAKIKKLDIGHYTSTYDDDMVIKNLSHGSFSELSFYELITPSDASLLVDSEIKNFYFTRISRGAYDLLIQAGKKVEAGEILDDEDAKFIEKGSLLIIEDGYLNKESLERLLKPSIKKLSLKSVIFEEDVWDVIAQSNLEYLMLLNGSVDPASTGLPVISMSLEDASKFKDSKLTFISLPTFSFYNKEELKEYFSSIGIDAH